MRCPIWTSTNIAISPIGARGLTRGHGTESGLTNHTGSHGNESSRLQFAAEGLGCRVFFRFTSHRRGLVQRRTAQQIAPEGLGVNLTSEPWLPMALKCTNL